MPLKSLSRFAITRGQQTQGFSLLEVLISVFVFATGILGIAGLQLKSLSMLSNSNSVNVAIFGANDFADRMRANPIGVTDGAYDSLVGSSAVDPGCSPSCSGANLATFDAFSVFKQLKTDLPSPSLTVSDSGNGIFTIEITWLERVGVNTETKSHRVSFMPYKP